MPLTGGGNRSDMRKPCAMLYCLQPIPHDPTCDKTWASDLELGLCKGKVRPRAGDEGLEGEWV